MHIIKIIVLIFILSSCIQHSESNESKVVFTEKKSVEIRYAKGFNVDESNANYTKIEVNSENSVYNFRDSIFIFHNDTIETSGKKTVQKDYKSLTLQSSTYLAYLNVLNKVELVKGICGLQYVNSTFFTDILIQNNTQEVSIGGSVQMESLLNVNPDLFLIFPFELDNKEKYEEKGIQTLLISEYLESTPLARLEWIKLFGLVLGEVNKANSYFLETEKKYNAIKVSVDSANTMFFNLPFKENWNMPSSNSITSNLVKDAGFNYIYSDSTNDNSVRSKEQVWDAAMNCEYWIIIASRPADFSIAKLKEEQKVYTEFPAVKNGKVIFCNTTNTDYFTKGVVEPDIMLKDLIYAIHPIKGYESTYFKILE
jgi:iron complex transport system substrate-binding protein